MYGYDLSSRRRMLKGGRYCLMKFCSASSASASVVDDERVDRVDHRQQVAAHRVLGLEKCEATRLRIDFALPT